MCVCVCVCVSVPFWRCGTYMDPSSLQHTSGCISLRAVGVHVQCA